MRLDVTITLVSKFAKLGQRSIRTGGMKRGVMTGRTREFKLALCPRIYSMIARVSATALFGAFIAIGFGTCGGVVHNDLANQSALAF
jgi:hypothetical protein